MRCSAKRARKALTVIIHAGIAGLIALSVPSISSGQTILPDLRPAQQPEFGEPVPELDEAPEQTEALPQQEEPAAPAELPGEALETEQLAEPEGDEAQVDPESDGAPIEQLVEPEASVAPAPPLQPPAGAGPGSVEPPPTDAGGDPPEAPPAGSSSAAPPAPAESRIQPLRLGILPRGDVARTISALEPLRETLAAELGRAVEIVSVSSYRALIDAQMLQRIDGGFYSASAYATASALCECVEPIVAPAAADGTTAYHAIILARRGSGITSLKDLEGRTVATAAPDSVGGRRMQLAGMMAEGYDLRSYFGRVRTAASAADAVRLLAAGEVDAAFAWSSLEGDVSLGYSRGTLTLLVASGEIAMSDYDVVWRSPPIAHGPLAVAKSLPDEQKAALRDVLLDLELDEPAIYDLLAPLYGGGFDAVDPSDYSGVAILAEYNVDRVLPAPTTMEAPAGQAEVAAPVAADPGD